ncbi:MAG: hypothetical protein BWY96_03077 [Spirochaetes bacterium ADurb.BinA120]|nr:MAG: hypothetical protein BWY96_03077 [Spirochaetes bacterium ADurb.BinA120]
MRYRTILADPPWNETGGSRSPKYPLMKTSEIIGLSERVRSLSEDDAHLYLWVTNNFLPDGLSVIEAWGFNYKTVITWIKNSIGIGQYFRGATEICLFATKGKTQFKVTCNGIGVAQASGAFYGRKSIHSKKPNIFYSIIEKVSPPPYLEMFARQKREGWDAWGNDVAASPPLFSEART